MFDLRKAVLFVASMLSTSCALPEIPKQPVDPNNRGPQLLSCSGIRPYKETPPGPDQVEIAGYQEPGKYDVGRVIVRFVVLPDGTVDPSTIEINEGGENIGRSKSALAPTREMLMEARSVAKTCLYKPALKDGAPVSERVATSFILTRDT